MTLVVPPPRPRKQHVVSQVLLRRFAVDGKVEVASLEYPNGPWLKRAPAAVGYVRDFVRADVSAVEQAWAEVEGRLAAAFSEVDQGGIIKAGGAIESALRDCLALHWARSIPIRAAVDQAWLRVRARSFADLEGRPAVLDRAFQQLTGLHADGPEARAIANEMLHEGPEELQSGEHFAERVLFFFECARTKLAATHVAVYDLPTIAGDLLLADSPVVTPNRSRTGWRPGQVALDDAVGFAMPIGPRVAISANDAPTRHTVSVAQVDELNQMQKLVADAHVFRRPRPRHEGVGPKESGAYSTDK